MAYISQILWFFVLLVLLAAGSVAAGFAEASIREPHGAQSLSMQFSGVQSLSTWSTRQVAFGAVSDMSLASISDTDTHDTDAQNKQLYPVVIKHTELERYKSLGLDEVMTEHYKALVYKVLGWLPRQHALAVKEITISHDASSPRGLGGGNRIFIRAFNVPDEEFAAVLVHEIGHVVDTGLMQGSWASGYSNFLDGKVPIYRSDASIGFYAFSWNSNAELLDDSKGLDFVSGYSRADSFEDFAESYAYYLLHGKSFRLFSLTNSKLNGKYYYLRECVFDGMEYDTGSTWEVYPGSRVYDITKLLIDINATLAVKNSWTSGLAKKAK